MNRRSSAGSGRMSLGAQRVKQSGDKPRPRLSSTSISNNGSGGGRFSMGGSVGRPSFGGRPSMPGLKKPLGTNSALTAMGPNAKKRRSSMRSTYGSEIMKDPRPITEKAYKERCMRQLIEFLTEKNYTYPITLKMLHQPQSKDFLHIFEFMITFLDAKFKMKGRMEEEIPKVLKAYYYPFTIPKSAMFAVGSPHTWPTLLAALTWLREIIEYSGNLDSEAVLFPPDDNFESDIPELKVLFDYVSETYNDFLNGQDTFETQEEKFTKRIRENGAVGEMEQLANQQQTLEEEHDMLFEQPNMLGDLRNHLGSMKLDEEKFIGYLSNLEQHKKAQLKQDEDVDNELETAEAELQALLTQNKKKQGIFDTQEFSPADVQRINRERQELSQQIRGFDDEIASCDKSVCEAEISLGRHQDKIAGKCTEYNKMAQMLQLIPTSAANAYGIDYELKPTPSDIHTTHFHNVIKPALNQVKAQCVNKVYEAQNTKLNDLEALEQMKDMVNEKLESIATLEHQHKRLEENLDSKKELSNRENQRLQSEVDILHEEVAELKRQQSMTVQEAEKGLQDLKLRLQQKQKERQTKDKHFEDFLYKVVTMVVEHKSTIQEHMTKAATDYKETMEREVVSSKWTTYDYPIGPSQS